MSWSSPEHVRVSGSQHLRQASPRSRDSGTQPPSWSPQPASTCPNSGLLHLEKYSRQTLHTSDWGYCTTKPLLLFLFLQPVFEEHLKSYSFSRKSSYSVKVKAKRTPVVNRHVALIMSQVRFQMLYTKPHHSSTI